MVASAGLGDGREREREPEDLSRWKREREGAGKISLSMGERKPGKIEIFPRLIGLLSISSGQPGCPDSQVL